MRSVNISSSSISPGIHTLDRYAVDKVGNISNTIRINLTKPKVFNVKDYNARGDGITDDTQAIRNAIEAAKQYSQNNNNIPTIIYFPNGIYFTKQLVIYSNMYFVGEDMNNTILRRIVGDNTFYFKPFPYSSTEDMNDETGTFGYPNVPKSISTGHIALYYRPFIKNYDFVQGNTNLGFINITVDGNGYLFERDTLEGASNIHNILLCRCSNIYIDRLKSIDSNNIMVQIRKCDNITIKSMYLDGNSRGKFGTTETIGDKTVSHEKIYQAGLHCKGVTNLTADFIHTIFAGDDAITVNSDRVSPREYAESFNVYIKKAIVNSRLANGIRLYSEGLKDIYNITIDEVIVTGYRGRYDSNGISIMHWYHDSGTGTPHDITIKKVIIKSLGYEEGGGAFVHIHRGSDVAPYTPYNITIGDVILELDGTGTVNSLPIATFRRWAFRFEDLYGIDGGNSNVVINGFILNNMPKGIYDIDIDNVNGLILRNGTIRRMATHGTHISVNNSKNIILDNIQIPRIDTNNDGIADSNQGDIGLYIRGTSQYITARNCIFAVTNKYQYDDTARQYADTNQLDIR